MFRRSLVLAFATAAMLAVAVAPVCAATRGDARLAAPAPPATHVLDLYRRFDANQLDLWTTNFGSLAFDLATGNAGLEYPRGSGKTAVFAAGLWVGAQVGGEKRVTVAEYSQEWSPGRILPGGLPEDPAHADPTLRSWKVVPIAAVASVADTGVASAPSGDPVRHDSWSDYVANAGPLGAPVGTRRFPDTGGDPSDSVDVDGPDFPGELALWSVFNDADASAHTNDAGSTAPLGLEVQQEVFGFAADLPGVAYVRWTLVNRGATGLDSAYVGFWSDPDLGGAGDDLVAFNDWYGMGFAYNATNNDLQYGATPPAVAIQYLGGPAGAGLAAFGKYISGTDPSSALESYRALQGLDPMGNEYIDPTTGFPTRFMFLGDPITGQGWLDSNPADRRMMLSVGPFTLAPGASATFTFALIVARGGDRLSSIQRVQCAAIEARNAFNQDYQRPFPVLGPECTTVASCPAPASAWAALCADPSGLPPLALSTLAAGVFNRTRSFIPAIPYEDSFCAAVSDADPTIPRARAQREHLAFLANLVAPFVGGFVSGDQAIGLDSKTPVSCPWSAATTAGQLGEIAPQDLPLEATYFSVDDDPRDLQSVDFGLEAYGGGVGFGSSFFASSIDPFTHPDSFVTVELRFDAASTQKAYRYLRLTLDDGFSVPPGGREYRYAGYHTVPVEAIDVATGDRLELAFVEKAYVDAAGTMLPPGQQPATFDSTWLPSIASDGDREYLFVIRRGDTGSPRPDMEVDDVLGGITSTTAVPVLYAMALRRIAADEYPDPGEKLVITPFSAAPSEGVDARMLALAAEPQDDPATLAAYNEIADCLAVINAGIGPGCDITTPTTIAIEESSVEGGVVHLAWYVAGEGAGPYDLARRRNDAEAWTPLARLAVDGTRRVRYEDRNVAAGERWSYGLFDPRDPAHPLDVVDITLPGTPEFALRIGVGRGGRLPTLAFSLPTAGEARLEMFDASGRRRFGGSLGTLDAGPHVQAWPAGAPTDAGLLFVRLTFAGKSVLGRAVVLR